MSNFLENGKATRNSILIEAAYAALRRAPRAVTLERVIQDAADAQERCVGIDDVYAAERAARSAFRRHYSYVNVDEPVEPAKMAHRLLFLAMQVPA